MAPCFLAGNIPRRHLVVFFLAAGELGLAAATDTPPVSVCVAAYWSSVFWTPRSLAVAWGLVG